MKKQNASFALILALALLVCYVPVVNAESSNEITYILLFEGETLFGDWAYQLLDVDNNGVNDLITFANVTTTPDTTRL
ncbi:MAG TPA: hypothetical protein GXZ61_04145 [Clostridiales bacterium]|jgi:hypothetical protein|nr:hypothetical protein [Clostridiales bacterium]